VILEEKGGRSNEKKAVSHFQKEGTGWVQSGKRGLRKKRRGRRLRGNGVPWLRSPPYGPIPIKKVRCEKRG